MEEVEVAKNQSIQSEKKKREKSFVRTVFLFNFIIALNINELLFTKFSQILFLSRDRSLTFFLRYVRGYGECH